MVGVVTLFFFLNPKERGGLESCDVAVDESTR